MRTINRYALRTIQQKQCKGEFNRLIAFNELLCLQKEYFDFKISMFIAILHYLNNMSEQVQQKKGQTEQEPQEKNQNFNNQNNGEEQQQQPNPDALTEQDQQNYRKIKASLDSMNDKIKKAKNLHSKNNPRQSAQHSKQIAEKLITSKQNSQIINKESLLTEINQSFEKVVVDIYSQNQLLRKQVKQMQKTIRQQNHKISLHIYKQEEIKKQNQKLRQQIADLKDQNIMQQRGSQPVAMKTSPKARQMKQKGQYKQENNQDYDFWSMPQNQSNMSKKKDYVSDSGLWANNQKDIGDSMFITEQPKKRR